jgi:UDP-galactopyranose mutase
VPVAVDYLIVGAGLTGATIARRLADAGREVLVVDRRNHVGGNVHDTRHSSGIRIHTYGPHYFRTNSDRLWAYVNRFGPFFRFEARVRSTVDGELVDWPIRESYLRRVAGPDWRPAFSAVPANFEQAALAIMPASTYEKLVRPYTEKQWGVPAASLSVALAQRLEVRRNEDSRLMRHKHQGLPVAGYAAWTARMLAGIPVALNLDYLRDRDAIIARRLLVFTGPIDELFGFDLGRLSYRGQRRQHSYHPDLGLCQPCGQVNNPLHENGPNIRTIEWKHMMPQDSAADTRGTVLTTETPFTPTVPDQYEYPFPDASNRLLFERYRARARAMPRLLVCGRLGEYRYHDMDQAIARALVLARSVLRHETRAPAVGWRGGPAPSPPASPE